MKERRLPSMACRQRRPGLADEMEMPVIKRGIWEEVEEVGRTEEAEEDVGDLRRAENV